MQTARLFIAKKERLGIFAAAAPLAVAFAFLVEHLEGHRGAAALTAQRVDGAVLRGAAHVGGLAPVGHGAAFDAGDQLEEHVVGQIFGGLKRQAHARQAVESDGAHARRQRVPGALALRRGVAKGACSSGRRGTKRHGVPFLG